MNEGRRLYGGTRSVNLVLLYRTAVCIISLVAVFTCVALKLSLFFDPVNLEEITLRNLVTFEFHSLLREDSHYSGKEWMTREEIFDFEEGGTVKAPSEKTGGIYPITEIDMSAGAESGEVLVQDGDSGVEVDIAGLLQADFPAELKRDSVSKLGSATKPLVLIIHTHATECYSEEGADSYSPDTSFRSNDTERNVVAVGAVMKEILDSRGIYTLHCRELHDAESYNASYTNSLESVKKYLELYPSIKYVFDVHRDAIIKADGEAYKPTVIIDGNSTAQVMTLVGTNQGGADHPLWLENNMNLAVKLQRRLTAEHDGMARPINTRNASFNQQYAPGSLLFEVGSCVNTLQEAKNAAVRLATAIADTIIAEG